MRCRVLAPYAVLKDNAVVHNMKVGFVVDVDDDLVDELVAAKKVVPVKPRLTETEIEADKQAAAARSAKPKAQA
jgi:hypothetical protein